jgi:hypothetical protein
LSRNIEIVSEEFRKEDEELKQPFVEITGNILLTFGITI